MNPLCCIAPVSIEKDQATPLAAKLGGQYQLGLDLSRKTVKPCPSAQVFVLFFFSGFDGHGEVVVVQ
ncbi:hypothetical protein SO802_020730 [Lithocarpus litseifolius]|uniref:Uncharacterized protein n=1 Tax=Lithocarpus litseifolius TaxID=425828 RepID=A0AAW2CFM9_9ROSI